MNLPATAAVLVAFRSSSARIRLDLLLAGGLVGIAFLIKQPAGIVLLPLGLYCIHPAYARTCGLQRAWGWVHGALVAAGFGLTMGLAALVLWKFHILDAAWYWSVVNHDTVHGPGDVVFWQRALRGAGFWVLFCGPLLVGAFRALFGTREIWDGHRAERDALVVLLLASVVGVSAGGRFFGHYFIQLIPPLALLAAHPLAESWSRIGEERGRGWRRLTLGWSALSLLVTLGIHTASAASSPRPSEAAAWLRDHAGPGDRLFVWGQYPHLYFLTGLRPASRYISCYPLTGYIFGAPESDDPNFDTSRRITPGAWDSLAVDLQRHPPRFLVDEYAARARPLYPMQRFPLLDTLVRAHYSIAYRARDGVIYQRGP
jgi:4-amino-4-deoxy-L-arabinose transferase-like glycosyltransferase